MLSTRISKQQIRGNSMVSAYAILGVVAFLWGGNYVVIRIGLESLDPIVFNCLRFGISGIIMMCFLKWREGSVRIAKTDIWKFAVLGIVGTTLLESFVVLSIDYTTLSNSSILSIAPWPIFAALFAPLFTKERLNVRMVLYGLLSLLGVLIVIGTGGTLSLDSNMLKGNLLALAVSILGGIYSSACIPLLRRYSSLKLTTWMFLFGTLFLIPVALPALKAAEWTTLINYTAVGALLFNIFIITILCFMLWNSAMLRVGATKASFYRYLTPVAAVVAGFIFYREPIYAGQLIGASLMLAGLIGISRVKEKLSVS